MEDVREGGHEVGRMYMQYGDCAAGCAAGRMYIREDMQVGGRAVGRT